MSVNSVLPPRSIFCEIVGLTSTANWTEDDGLGDPWVGTPYRWSINANVSYQAHSSHLTPTYQFYSGTDVKVGDWIADISSGKAVKILSIDPATTATWLVCTVEDVERYNTFTDFQQGGTGVPFGQSIIFELGTDGLPVFGPITAYSTNLGANHGWVGDLLSRFRYRNFLKRNYRVQQSNNGFAVGDAIYLLSTGLYAKADSTTSVKNRVIGTVTDVNRPGNGWFTYRPIGEVVQNITTTLPGNPGDIIWVSSSSPGTYTATKPTTGHAKALYIKIDNTTGVSITTADVDLASVAYNGTLSSLSDVSPATPTTGQILSWNQTISKWEPAPAPQGFSGKFTDLTLRPAITVSGNITGTIDLSNSSATLNSPVSSVAGKTGAVTLVLNDISNVNTTSLIDGQLLYWNASASQWRSKTMLLDELSDVNVGTPTVAQNGYVLTWNNASGQFQLQNPQLATTTISIQNNGTVVSSTAATLNFSQSLAVTGTSTVTVKDYGLVKNVVETATNDNVVIYQKHQLIVYEDYTIELGQSLEIQSGATLVVL